MERSPIPQSSKEEDSKAALTGGQSMCPSDATPALREEDRREGRASLLARGRWAYPEDHSDRDLRIDFLRGMVLFVLIIIHIDIFSFYNFLVWERIGCISGGEGFVILSGVVVGMVYRKKIAKQGWRDAVLRLLDRAVQLYRINVFVIASIALLSLVPFIDAQTVMTFNDRVAGQTYPLYPNPEASLQEWVAKILLLQVGPHQLQVLGLYVVLMGVSPIALWFMCNERTAVFLLFSWVLYFKNWAFPSMLTGAQFEYAFPVLTWQLIYFHGMAAGFHREKIATFMQGPYGKPLLVGASILFLGFLFFAQNTTNPNLPSYARLHIIPPEIFDSLYSRYFMKNTLGILRVANYVVALVVGYALFTRFWVLWERTFGWFLIPVGQASLYAFIVHVYIVLLLGNFAIFAQENIGVNTAAHTFALLLIWLMVKKEVFFRWIPH
ncbi:MAG: OpgC domain-containing protein [Deltaproteobacteria bacterium]|nr:OpgC domain-containing protein [Deltaproteobacteria bacterium]